MSPGAMKHSEDRHLRSLLTTCLLLRYFVTSGYAECQYPTRRNNMALTEETQLMNDFPEGSEASLQCAKGYVRLTGSGTATCTAGQWSEIDLVCKEKDCGPIKDMPHITYQYNKGTLFGAMAKASCDKGYDIVGPSYIHCHASGWTNLPTCEVVICKEPPQIDNGKITSTYSDPPEYQEVIIYSCDEAYVLVGNSSIMCTEDGVYSPSPPQCIEPNIVTKEDHSHTEPPTEATTTATSTATPSTQGGDEEEKVTNSPNGSEDSLKTTTEATSTATASMREASLKTTTEASSTSTASMRVTLTSKGTTHGAPLLGQENATHSTPEPHIEEQQIKRDSSHDILPKGNGGDEREQDANKTVFYVILIGGLVVGGAFVICFIMGMIYCHGKKGSYDATRGQTSNEELTLWK